jgi:hypothetical protein
LPRLKEGQCFDKLSTNGFNDYSFATGSYAPPGTALETGEQ